MELNGKNLNLTGKMEGAREAFENNAKDPPSENCLSQVQIYFELAEQQAPLTIKEGSGHPLLGVIKNEHMALEGIAVVGHPFGSPGC